MIVASSAVAGHPQRDGRHYVVETHRHDDGSVEVLEYGPIVTSKVDLQAIADERAQRLNAERADQATDAQDRKAAEDKALAVLAAALGKGELTEDELRKAGLPVPSDRVADAIEVAIDG